MAVASTAADLISLDALKMEFRIPSGETSLDSLLSRHRAAAVRYVQTQVGRPLVRKAATKRLATFPAEFTPLSFDRDFEALTSLSYWTPEANLRPAGDGSILPADLGRTEARPDETLVYWPAGRRRGG